ncbi:hypothetical protein B5M06_10680 [Comamonas kerstersii]|uniref:Uncharacterized protein n=1 Tax=Comamonas kerstersii TaxID=225992 RepID=A0A0W7Z0P2_9BURK|nr:hypothetical protein B5M06_10680 [Comamonas kerstersii]KUF40999.1 hypothetical protein AS359_09260 [Comamonas kerstersii]OOH92713.1 hypothetical protein BMF29_06305 [Comamonas kerstersii]
MGLQPLHIHQHQAINTTRKVGVYAKVQKAYTVGLCDLGVLLVERRHTAAHMGQQMLQAYKICSAVVSRQLGMHIPAF